VDSSDFSFPGNCAKLIRGKVLALQHWLQLSLTDGIGPILARRMIEAAGSAEAACGIDIRMLREVEGIGSAKASKIANSLRAVAVQATEELERASAVGARIICPEDDCYPLLLNSIPDPPLVLYVKGTIEPRDLNSLAIVGSRRCSFYGREQAERFGALLAGAGLTVISGGARGIDSAAHHGAMAHPQGRTLAVLGCGINVVYPPENTALFDRIAGQGAVISEYPIDTPPAAENFPRRNRIVSGMSRGVLVIEADKRSGALITARQACDDHGRPVFALPGRVDNQLSVGPHLLIRDGATLVTNLEEILEGIGPLPHEAIQIKEPQTSFVAEASPVMETIPGLSDRQAFILSHLSFDAASVDWIIEQSGLEAPVVIGELTFLCLKGAVRRVDGQTFARAKR
jgi:DNA processing protein